MRLGDKQAHTMYTYYYAKKLLRTNLCPLPHSTASEPILIIATAVTAYMPGGWCRRLVWRQLILGTQKMCRASCIPIRYDTIEEFNVYNMYIHCVQKNTHSHFLSYLYE